MWGVVALIPCFLQESSQSCHLSSPTPGSQQALLEGAIDGWGWDVLLTIQRESVGISMPIKLIGSEDFYMDASHEQPFLLVKVLINYKLQHM